MDWRELKERCLAWPGAVEEFPFGDEVSVFKVGGKMFALSQLDGEPLQVSVKCDPELAVQLRAAYAAIGPGYHLNKRHWNTITLDGSVADEMVGDLLGDSYDLVVGSLPKARRPPGRVSADLTDWRLVVRPTPVRELEAAAELSGH
jgi:predicted DNA-binding protein (MmcQ/YjbR family)